MIRRLAGTTVPFDTAPRTRGEKGELVITSNGNLIALLSDVNESNLEDYLRNVRRIRGTLAVNSIQKRSMVWIKYMQTRSMLK